MIKKSQQEEAYEYVSKTFLKLLQQDPRIGSESREDVLASWDDLFEHEGVRNNMLQAFGNFMDEIDKRMDASRKAGIAQLRDQMILNLRSTEQDNERLQGAIIAINRMANELLAIENSPEQVIPVTENVDLTEVGGGDEDDTPLL